MDPLDERHKTPKVNVHYKETVSGNFICLNKNKNCTHKVAVDRSTSKAASRNSIVNHCARCFPNLKKKLDISKKISRKKHPEANLRSSKNSYHGLKHKETEAIEAAEVCKFSCKFCKKSFATHSAYLICEKNVQEVRMKRVTFQFSLLANVKRNSVAPINPDSQECKDSEGKQSEMEVMFLEVMENNQRITAASTSYVLYFVLFVPKHVKKSELTKHIRDNSNNPKCVFEYYVGKRCAQQIDHNIFDDHFSRESSIIVEKLEADDKTAYEIRREIFKTKAELDGAEAFWIAHGRYGEFVMDSEDKSQWKTLNKRTKVTNFLTLLTEKERHDAIKLAEMNLPLICAVENCSKDHNTRKRSRFSKWHCKDEDFIQVEPKKFKMGAELKAKE